jgi:hypothetical protein
MSSSRDISTVRCYLASELERSLDNSLFSQLRYSLLLIIIIGSSDYYYYALLPGIQTRAQPGQQCAPLRCPDRGIYRASANRSCVPTL